MKTTEKLHLMAEMERRNNDRWQSRQDIRVTFRNGRTVTYTMAILNLLKTDPDVQEIMDCQTGGMLHIA